MCALKGGQTVSGCIQMSSRPPECGNDSHATLPVAHTHTDAHAVDTATITHTAVLPISISLNAPQENRTLRKTKNVSEKCNPNSPPPPLLPSEEV